MLRAEFLRIGDAAVWLRRFDRTSGLDIGQGSDDQVGPGSGHPVVQGGGGFQRVDPEGGGGQHRALVQPLGHAHDLNACDLVAGHDRPLDRRGAPPARQQ